MLSWIQVGSTCDQISSSKLSAVLELFWFHWKSLWTCIKLDHLHLLKKVMATHSSTLPGWSHGPRTLESYSPWGHKESNSTKQLSTHASNLLIYSVITWGEFQDLETKRLDNRATWNTKVLCNILGFPGGSVVSYPPAKCRRCRRHRFNPWIRKIPWRRKWQPTQVYLPEKSNGQSTGHSPCGRK